MPEGDTIHKVAAYLADRLVGRSIRRLRMAGACDDCVGRRIERVYAHGKHLFIALDNDKLLRTHLGMYGSWHRYREGETWRKPASRASLELATEDEVFVCFNAKEIEILPAGGVRERILQTHLGPDLIDLGADLAPVVRRSRDLLAGDTALADVLLDQRVAAGIGNVYKSEVLFLERLLPQSLLAAVTDPVLAACYAQAADLLRRNLGGGPRVTRFVGDGGPRLWVYGRARLPCLRCGAPIRYARFGKDRRATYWCGGCQV